MTTITVATGATFHLHRPLSSLDTVNIQPGALLIADKLSFIAPADIVIASRQTATQRDGLLEIKHVPPVKAAVLDFRSLTLEFANAPAGLPTAITLNTTGTGVGGDIHPEQVKGGNGTFFFGAPLSSGFHFPPHTASIPTAFVL